MHPVSLVKPFSVDVFSDGESMDQGLDYALDGPNP
jgi:hypothetical protein